MKPLQRRSQRVALASAMACALLLALLAVAVRHLPAQPPLGWRAYRVVDYRPMPRWLATGLEALGTAGPFAVCVSLLVVAALALRDRFLAVVALVGPMLALALAEASKPVVGPHQGRIIGFPSGHTTAFAAIMTIIVISVHRRWGTKSSWAVAAALGLAGTGMTVAVVRSHRHLMTDALGGDLLGVGTVLGCAGLLSLSVVRFGWPITSIGEPRNEAGQPRSERLA